MDANGNFTGTPIDLGGAGDIVYPSLYGTGIRNLASLSAVTASINYRFSAVVTYAGGRKSTYAGLDQLN